MCICLKPWIWWALIAIIFFFLTWRAGEKENKEKNSKEKKQIVLDNIESKYREELQKSKERLEEALVELREQKYFREVIDREWIQIFCKEKFNNKEYFTEWMIKYLNK